MIKFVKICKSLLKNPYYLEICDLNKLRDAIFEAIDRIRKLEYEESFPYSYVVNRLKKILDDQILRGDRKELIMIFDKIRNGFHNNGKLLAKIYNTEDLGEILIN